MLVLQIYMRCAVSHDRKHIQELDMTQPDATATIPYSFNMLSSQLEYNAISSLRNAYDCNIGPANFAAYFD